MRFELTVTSEIFVFSQRITLPLHGVPQVGVGYVYMGHLRSGRLRLHEVP